MRVPSLILLLLCAILFPSLAAAEEPNRTALPIPQGPFKGRIGLRPGESVKDFPVEVKAPKDAPNILLILTDDVGFGAASTFGGPIPTPTFDRVADSGLRFNQFHTTALCSPTRAALITGRNHHSVATGGIMEIGVGYPGYNTLVPKSCGTVAQILKYNGYNTSWFGKNHNVPDWHTSQAGPFDLWPVGLGFEYFYGFIGGDTNMWAPAIVENTTPIEPPHDDPNYNFDEDMADKAIAWMRMQHAVAPDKPFLAYYATGTAHAPHHAPRAWIDKFKGKFDQGWDKVREETHARQIEMGVIPKGTRLTERSQGIGAWDSLNADQKKVYARMMEVYAAALSHADHQMGRLLDSIEEMGELDNTLIIYIQGDNGASAEGSAQGLLNEMSFFNNVKEPFSEVLRRMDELGGPLTFNHYPIGWAHAMDTPFQWTKQVASHFGGTRNAMALSWPKRIKEKGGLRKQFHHVVDILPTVLAAAGLPAPTRINGITQRPIQGVNMTYTFDDADAKGARHTQYFEMFGNRAIYHDGWVACTTPTLPPWASTGDAGDVISDYKWELYNIAEDFSQSVDLAAKEPQRLREMQILFYMEAIRNNALPLDNSKVERLDVSNRPSLTEGRTRFSYIEGMTRIPEGSAPDVKNKDWSLTAEVEIPEGGAEGVILTQGGRFCGWTLFLKAGKPVFHYNTAGVYRYDLASDQALKPGKHTIRFEFDYQGEGPGGAAQGTLMVDGSKVAESKFEHTVGYRMSLDETLDCGEDTGTPASEAYRVPFKFTGDIREAVIELPK